MPPGFRKSDDPRDDLILAITLTSAVIVIGLISPILSWFGISAPNLGYIEEIDFILGPIVAAGTIGIYLEDRAYWKKNGGR